MAEARREATPPPPPPGSEERIERLKALFESPARGIAIETSANATGEVVFTVHRDDVLGLCRVAFADAGLVFDHCRFITGVDQLDAGIEIVYSLWSYPKRHSLFIKTLLPPTDPHVASVTSIWATADWHERETAEMFGVVFDGHPNPKHLLLDDDLEIHPLLKAHPLAPVELKQGVNSF